MTFRAALRQAALFGHGADNPVTITVNEKDYCVWYNPQFQAINIQGVLNWHVGNQEDKLGIIIDVQGNIISVKVNNVEWTHASIPEEFSERVRNCFKKALELSSRYVATVNSDQPIQAIVVRRGLKEIPTYHLKKISTAIEQGMKRIQDPKIRVSFLRDDLTTDAGIDAGGLSRDYLDDLFGGIKESKEVSFANLTSSFLTLPRSKQEYEPDKPFPALQHEEKDMLTNMGKLMMYCYHSKATGHFDQTFSLGRHVDDALFKAVLCLNAEEVDTPFEQLSLETKLKIGQALLEARTESGENLQTYFERLNWLSKYEALDETQLKKAAETVCFAELLPDEFTVRGEGQEPDMEKIEQNKEAFKKCLIDSVFSPYYEHGQQLGAQIAPIHAIAQGMKSLCHPGSPGTASLNDNNYWNTEIKNVKYVDFSTKIQGSLDRNEIANGIRLEENIQGAARVEITKKVEWLKEWLKDKENGATDEEVRKLLKFLTGSTSFPTGKKIAVKTQYGPLYMPVPVAHTCSFEVELAPIPSSYGNDFNDHTKDNFIKSLKELVLKDPDSYSMA